jgi:hypothetical protein
MPRLKLDQHINVAIRPEIVAQHRAEKGQLSNMMPAAEVGKLRAIDRDPSHAGLLRSDFLHPIS